MAFFNKKLCKNLCILIGLFYAQASIAYGGNKFISAGISYNKNLTKIYDDFEHFEASNPEYNICYWPLPYLALEFSMQTLVFKQQSKYLAFILDTITHDLSDSIMTFGLKYVIKENYYLRIGYTTHSYTPYSELGGQEQTLSLEVKETGYQAGGGLLYSLLASSKLDLFVDYSFDLTNINKMTFHQLRLGFLFNFD